jgi:hypothetical protein
LPIAQCRFSNPRAAILAVMLGFVPASMYFFFVANKGVDGRDKPGHDELDEELINGDP